MVMKEAGHLQGTQIEAVSVHAANYVMEMSKLAPIISKGVVSSASQSVADAHPHGHQNDGVSDLSGTNLETPSSVFHTRGDDGAGIGAASFAEPGITFPDRYALHCIVYAHLGGDQFSIWFC